MIVHDHFRQNGTLMTLVEEDDGTFSVVVRFMDVEMAKEDFPTYEAAKKDFVGCLDDEFIFGPKGYEQLELFAKMRMTPV